MAVRLINTDSKVPSYSDVDILFTKNPKTGDLLTVSNMASVKQSIRNLLSTSFGERLFQPRLGCSLRNLLFEPIDEITAMEIRDRVIETIRKHEPRIGTLLVDVSSDSDGNSYIVNVEYGIAEVKETQTVNVTLERIR
jgi:phage baseplate assembly protein W